MGQRRGQHVFEPQQADLREDDQRDVHGRAGEDGGGGHDGGGIDV